MKNDNYWIIHDRDQSLKLGDGPRHSQVFLLVLLWVAAVMVALESVNVYLEPVDNFNETRQENSSTR